MPENSEGWEFETFARVYTEVPVEKLRSLPYYDSEKENYVLPENFCFGEEKYPVVTYVYELDDTVSVFYDIIDTDGKIIGSRELVVKIVEDKIDGWGSRWEYLGCYERE